MISNEVQRYSSFSDNIIGTKSIYKAYNTIIRRYPDHAEILRRDDVNFVRRKGFVCSEIDVADRRPRFALDEGGLLSTNKPNVTLSDLFNTLRRSRSRSLDSIYDYALSNKWDYFMTFTFDPRKIEDRYCRFDIVSAWSAFRSKVYYYDRKAKFLCIPEKHPKSGAIHLHALVAGDFDSYLTPAFSPDGKSILSSIGDQIYNLSLYEYGFTTVAKLDRNNLRVANYLTKYISKDCLSIAGYKQRTFLSSHGLKRCTREYVCLDTDQFIDLLAERVADDRQYRIDQTCKTVLKKISDRFIVYVQSWDIYSQKLSLTDDRGNFTY